MKTIPSTTKERKPLLALTAAFLMSGLGQIYNGEYSKGLSFFLIPAFTLPIAVWIGLRGPESFLLPMMLLGVCITLIVHFVAIIDAYRSSKRIGKSFELKPLNKPFAYVALFFFGNIFVMGQVTLYIREKLIESYVLASKSMVPSLLNGDYIFVDKQINRPGTEDSVHRGDLVTFINPNNRTQSYIKRVIGLPGDQVEIKGTIVSVNGKSIMSESPIHDLRSPALNPLLKDHIAFQEKGEVGQYTVIWKKSENHENRSLTVPNGQVFVLGDNRDASSDSRYIGTIPLVDVTGKVKQVWFSFSSEDGIRWERLGKVLR